MTEKDFSTIKKTLRILQKVQATTKVYAFWINYNKYYDNTISVGVTIFRYEGDIAVPFDFYNFSSPEKRLEIYNKMMNFING